MRKRKERTPSVGVVAALSSLSVLLALGTAGCNVGALFGSGGGRRGGGAAGGGGSSLASLAQLRSDSSTMIPPGGSVPEASIVLRAVVRDTAVATRRLEVELRPVGTAFQGQPTATSDPTPGGSAADVLVSGLQDNMGYHWQARAEGATEWQAYSGNVGNAPDFRVALPIAANHLVFTSHPTTTSADSTIAPVKVSVVDGQNNTITGYTGTVSVTLVDANGATLGGDSHDIPVQSGSATFSNLSITKAGSGYRLDATSDGLATVTSNAFAIKPYKPDHWVFLTQPNNTPVNTPISPPVRVAAHDKYSNVVTSFTETVYMNIGTNPLGGTLQPGGTQRAAAAGIATFEDLRIDRVGVGYTLVAGTCCMRDGASNPFDITP